MNQTAALTVSALLGLLAARAVAAPRPPAPTGWFHVYPLDARTYAISEPKYWQQNVSYLLLGSHQALLFDTGPGLYSIRTEVAHLTSLPVMVIPSHLHFDHVGDVQEFSDVRLLDTPALRAQVQGDYFVEPPTQYQLRSGFRYHVSGWIKDGETIDLGGRRVLLIATPGHTPDSVSLVDEDRKHLFTGDLLNRMATIVSVPGSDIHQESDSLRHVLSLAAADGKVYEAHAEAPVTRAELQQVAQRVAQIAAGHGTTPAVVCLGGTPMRRFTLGPFPFLLPGPKGERQPPLSSATEEVNFDGSPCK
jgi:glyoxylase-like metal-dependent hydrolase (beta-lactamase superfamily II)